MGEIPCKMTQGGYYKIPIYNDDVVPKELFDEEQEARIKAETKLELLQNILSGKV